MGRGLTARKEQPGSGIHPPHSPQQHSGEGEGITMTDPSHIATAPGEPCASCGLPHRRTGAGAGGPGAQGTTHQRTTWSLEFRGPLRGADRSGGSLLRRDAAWRPSLAGAPGVAALSRRGCRAARHHGGQSRHTPHAAGGGARALAEGVQLHDAEHAVGSGVSQASAPGRKGPAAAGPPRPSLRAPRRCRCGGPGAGGQRPGPCAAA